MRSGFYQISILAIIMAILTIGAGVGAVAIFKNQKVSEFTQAAKPIQQQPDEPSEIEKLRKEVEELKNREPQVVTQTIIKEAPVEDKVQIAPQQQLIATIVQSKPNQEVGLTDIVGNWRLFTARLECPDSSQSYLSHLGSGFITKGSDGNFKVLTNRHVVENSDVCRIRFPGDPSHIFQSILISQAIGTADFASISLGNSDEYLKGLIAGGAYYGICGENKKPVLGDEIIILGYPGIGSETDVTVTRGIISGFEGIYFITDTKIDHGNSGGAAISIKNNCYFGPPTRVKFDIESLGRILDIWKVMGQF